MACHRFMLGSQRGFVATDFVETDFDKAIADPAFSRSRPAAFSVRPDRTEAGDAEPGYQANQWPSKEEEATCMSVTTSS